MNDCRRPEQRSFPDTLLQQQKEYLMSEIRRKRASPTHVDRDRRDVARWRSRRSGSGRFWQSVLRSASSCSRAADHPSVAQITVTTARGTHHHCAGIHDHRAGIHDESFNLEAVPVALLLQKALATLTPPEGEVLHIKTTSISDGTTTAKGTYRGEIWQIGGSSWMWRSVRTNPKQEVFEQAESWSSPYYNYDGVSDSLLELKKSTPGEPNLPADGWQRIIESLLTSGQAVKRPRAYRREGCYPHRPESQSRGRGARRERVPHRRDNGRDA